MFRRAVEFAFLFEHCPEIIVRFGIARVDGERPRKRRPRFVAALPLIAEHAETVVRLRGVGVEGDRLAVVFLGLRRVAQAAVKRDQVDMRLGEFRVQFEGLQLQFDGARRVGLAPPVLPPR